jgi:hypothetical protein
MLVAKAVDFNGYHAFVGFGTENAHPWKGLALDLISTWTGLVGRSLRVPLKRN